jgi:phosphatidylglycerophosphate synthase
VLVIDPIALRLLPWLVPRPWITPFRLTALAAVLGVASALAFGVGQLTAGALLYEGRFVVDCLDGKLARLRGSASPRGAFFDLGCDVVLIGANLGALGWYLVVERAVSPALPLAVVALSLVSFWVFLFDDTSGGGAGRSPAHPPPAGSRGLGRFLAAHRMSRAPRTVEAETLVLFLAPLTGSPGLVQGAMAVACLYYAVAATRVAVLAYLRLPGGSGAR